jgi:hypothetical protein
MTTFRNINDLLSTEDKLHSKLLHIVLFYIGGVVMDSQKVNEKIFN